LSAGSRDVISRVWLMTVPCRLTPLLALAFASALAACKDSSRSMGPSEDLPAASSPPPITFANAIGTCDDVEACEKDCDAGQGDRCGRLGATFEFGKSDAGRDPTRGTLYYDRACALGDAPGCVSSGRMHEYAHGVPKDLAVATAAYERACTLGYQAGCANWAIMLENGRGVPVDRAKARALYESACKAGAGLACDRMKALGREAADGQKSPMAK